MTQQTELKDLLKRISPSLKKKVQSCMFVTALGKNCVILETQKMILTAKAAPPEVNPGMSMRAPSIPQENIGAAQRYKNFLPTIVDNLGTELVIPEDVVVNQDNMPSGVD